MRLYWSIKWRTNSFGRDYAWAYVRLFAWCLFICSLSVSFFFLFCLAFWFVPFLLHNPSIRIKLRFSFIFARKITKTEMNIWCTLQIAVAIAFRRRQRKLILKNYELNALQLEFHGFSKIWRVCAMCHTCLAKRYDKQLDTHTIEKNHTHTVQV